METSAYTDEVQEKLAMLRANLARRIEQTGSNPYRISESTGLSYNTVGRRIKLPLKMTLEEFVLVSLHLGTQPEDFFRRMDDAA